MINLEGKVAFVAGAGSVGPGWGNGKATACLLARQGAAVFGTDIHPDAVEETRQLVEEAGGVFSARACDMTVSKDVALAVEACMQQFGKIDILINNCGGSAAGDPVSMSEEVWQAQLDLNLKTAFLGCKHVLPIMKKQSSGAIVNISSIASYSSKVGARVNVAYSTAKAGLAAFTRSTAIAYVKHGIRCNTVVVGVMHTPLVEQRLVQQLGAAEASTVIAERHASVPLGFMGTGWDTANAVAFLVSDEARYITGIELVVDGGVSVARA